jgi:hypothetical protein
MELSRDFQLVLAGGFVSLFTTIVMMLVIHLLFRLNRTPEQTAPPPRAEPVKPTAVPPANQADESG